MKRFLLFGLGACLLATALAVASVFAGWNTWAAAILIFEFLLGTFLLLRLATHLNGSLRQLSDQTRELGGGRRDSCNIATSDPEIQQVAAAINTFASGVKQERQAERERLQRALQTARSVIDALPQGVALISPDGQVEIANCTAARFGLQAGSPMGSSVPKGITALVSQTLAAARSPASSSSPSGSSASPLTAAPREMVQLFADGNEYFFLPQAHPVLDDRGQVIGITLVLVDVTAERQVDEAKSGLISSVSHQLKTPMTSIQMSIYLLMEDAADRLTPRQIELLHAARDDSDRLLRLIEDLLSTARERRGAQPPSPSETPNTSR